MTPENEQRIRELSRLIAAEKDNEKAVMLAAELRSLLTLRSEEKKTQRSSYPAEAKRWPSYRPSCIATAAFLSLLATPLDE